MTHDDRQTEEFFDKLSGRLATTDAKCDQGIAALRDALKKQIETIHQAEQATTVELSPELNIRLDALKQQLIERGLLGKPTGQTPAVRKLKPSWQERIRQIVFGSGWERPIALTASVLFISFIMMQAVLPPGYDTDVVRGGDASPVLIVSDPVATIDQLTKQLTQAGADVLPVQINNTQWTLQISAPKSADRAAIKRILEEAGIKISGDSPYTVSIKAK